MNGTKASSLLVIIEGPRWRCISLANIQVFVTSVDESGLGSTTLHRKGSVAAGVGISDDSPHARRR